MTLLACTRPMKPEEGEKYLRAFDNDLINLSKQIEDNPGFHALLEFIDLNASGHFLNPIATNDESMQDLFVFNDHKGIYDYDPGSHSFLRVAPSDSILIFFPVHSGTDTMATLIITSYSEDSTQLDMAYPTVINGCINLGDKQVLTIEHHGSVIHGFPVSGDMRMEFPPFLFLMKLQTKLYRDHAKMNLDMNLSNHTKDVFLWTINSGISVADDGSLKYNSVTMDFRMYPVRIEARVNYGRIDPYSTRFVRDFNRNSSIQIVSLTNDRFIGQIELEEMAGRGQLNIGVHFRDGSVVFMEDVIITFRKLVNMKMG